MSAQTSERTAPAIPDAEMVARAWHWITEEGAIDAAPFDGEDCSCRNHVPYALRLLALFCGGPLPEPNGLGAVVMNPLTGAVWVRAAHPSLPWHDPAAASPQQWSDPTCEDWFVWDDLPRPLVVQERGWTPPEPSAAPAPPSNAPEPTGIGALVVDTADEAWVRVHNGREPWLKVDQSGTGIAENWDGPFSAASWADLHHPVTVHSHGWQPPVNAS